MENRSDFPPNQNEVVNCDSDVIQAQNISNIEEQGETDYLPNLNTVDVTVSLVGIRAKKWEELEPLYKKHAAAYGFNFKKSTERRVGGVTFEKYFVCSCSGVPPEFASQKRKRNDIKTGCKAHMRVRFDNGSFRVESHNMFHNHPLTRPEWQHMHRVERNISQQKGEAMINLDEAGIRPTAAYRYLAHSAGGEENLGHTKKDHQNFVYRSKQKELNGNDAQLVLDELFRRKCEDPEFYFKQLLGVDGKLIALYWRDSKMKADYKIYRDVLIFDTTYKTNRYDLICAPFVGVNNHWNTVMFACAFIADEKKVTFEWLFNEFLTSMDQEKPVTIFTDQDVAMSAAIAQVFSKETRHRLCLWHIHKNATKHCGKLKKNKQFNADFGHILKGCLNQYEFQSKWDDLITKYQLQDDDWFKRLYVIREKWCTALSKDFFSAGILSSQRSESTNNAISFNASKTTSLREFLDIFSDTVERWRSTETTNEFDCSWKTPRSGVSAGLLKHASQVYTPTIFRYFEVEFETCLVSKAVFQISFGSKMSYVVFLEDGLESTTQKFLVSCAIAGKDVEITCNCKHFEEVGWLCSHCLRVLFVNNVTEIPDRYIKHRWTKDAKKHVWDKLGAERRQQQQGNDRLFWRQYMTRRFVDLILQSEGNMEARKMLEDSYTANALAIDGMNSARLENSDQVTTCSEVTSCPTKALDPDKSTTKGRRGKQKKRFGKRKAITEEVICDKPRNEQLV